MTDYAWNPDFHVAGDPAVVGRELEAIRERFGKLTAEVVVKAAANKRSPLHQLIYDGTTAEEALRDYRLNRARLVLRAIIISQPREETVVRGFHVVTIDGEREYVPAGMAASDPEWKAEVRASLERRMRALAQQLRGWDEFSGVLVAIEEALAA